MCQRSERQQSLSGTLFTQPPRAFSPPLFFHRHHRPTARPSRTRIQYIFGHSNQRNTLQTAGRLQRSYYYYYYFIHGISAISIFPCAIATATAIAAAVAHIQRWPSPLEKRNGRPSTTHSIATPLKIKSQRTHTNFLV